MTRINLIHPTDLMDQHLMAEFYEIRRIPKCLRRSLRAAEKQDVKTHSYDDVQVMKIMGEVIVLRKIPKAFTLGTGHVTFFYDKGEFLRKRYEAILEECLCRKFNINTDSKFDEDKIFERLDSRFNNDYEPSPEALAISRQRIAEKINQKPLFYKYYGASIQKIIQLKDPAESWFIRYVLR